jgi:GT2 family glycosyltransferase
MPDLLYTDENMFEKNCKSAYAPVYKPDFSMDTLRSFHYIGDFFLISLHAWKKLEKLNSDFSGRKGYQYLLLAGENEMSVAHIPKIMYYKKVIKGISSQDKIPWEEKMLREHLERTGYARGTSLKTSSDGIHRICYGLRETPLISIVIPNKDHVNDLKRCLESILNKTTYKQYEILVVENNSTEESVFRYYEDLEQDARIRVIYWSQEFNYSAINNFAVKQAKGEQIVLLNNDVEIISENWLEEMLMYAQREDVGAVGAMLYYPGDTIQHAGVILGIGGVAGHSHKHCKRGQKGYQYRLCTVQNLSAVTAACMMTSKKKFLEVGGLEQQLQIAFNDIDYCMKLRKKGYSIIFTPYAELYHYESISRGYETTSEKEERFRGEIKYFQEKWGSELEKGDPFYNPHLTLRYEDFRLK